MNLEANSFSQHVRCWRPKKWAEKMDTLLWNRHVNYLLRCAEWVRSSIARRIKPGKMPTPRIPWGVACPNYIQNRMMESLVLFDSVVNSRWFVRTSIILFLNKVDLFKQKLARSPLSNYFPDYSGGNDVTRAAKYLLWRFNQVNRAHLNLYPQYEPSFPCFRYG